MKKGIIIGLVAVIAVVGGVAVYVVMFAGDIIKQVVETVGSDATKTKVTLNRVDLSIQSGDGALNEFQMGNPAGFKTPKAMSFQIVSVKIDPKSVTSDVIVIREVVIAAPDISYEYVDGRSNFDVIQQNVDAYAKSLGAGGGSKSEPADSGGGKKVIIENLYVRDGKVSVSAGILAGKSMMVPLPTIHLKDIGKKENGATAGEVASLLLDEISGRVSRVGKAGLETATKAAKEAMEGARKAMEGGAEGAKKMLEGGASGAGGVMEDATKSIKGLFGK